MSDLGDSFREWREHKKKVRRELGVECPACIEREPRRNPTILLPGQRCFCGYVDPRSGKKVKP